MSKGFMPVLGRVFHDPALLPEVLSKLRSRLIDRRHRKRTSAYAGLAVTPTEGLAQLLGLDQRTVRDVFEAETLRRLLLDLAEYEIPPQALAMGGAAFLEACYAVVRLTRPKVVLETGVAHGYSTAAILCALAENGAGELHSVDLPMLSHDVVAFTGGAVPADLRTSGSWELILGPDRRVLPRLLQRLGPIDFFLYDSDKSYDGMLRTWRLVWPHLRPGAVLVLDDIHTHDAFLDFADMQGLAPLIIPKPARRGIYQWDQIYYAGLLRKAKG